MPASPPHDPDTVLRPPARLTLFGFGSTEAELSVVRRSRGWRLVRMLRVLAVTVLAAPVAGLVPPHAPWILGVLAGGLVLARRRWIHRFSVLDLSGSCPRCGSSLSVPSGARLRSPHPVPCETCHHQPTLELTEGSLPSG